MGDDAFRNVREMIRSRMVEEVLPGLAVAVARNGEILWEEGFGWADRENRVAADAHTMFSLASISKPITATGIMVLRERGALDLDRPVDEYLGEAKLNARLGDASEASVRRVANHTAGLPLHYQFFYEDEPYRRPPMDETIRRYGNLITAPGERYHYSNLGYGILDHVISRLSGRAYADFMREEVFLPLGMTRSSVDVAPGLEAFQAVRYGADGVGYPFYDFDHPGGSAVYSSAHDLVRFGMFHLKQRLPDQKAVLTDETRDVMQAPTAESGGGSGYGIGWATNTDETGYRTVGHGGGMGGVSTHLQMVPSEGIVVVALANASCDLPWKAGEEILDALLPERAARRAQARAEREAQEKRKQRGQADFKPAKDLLGQWGGTVHTYRGAIPLTLWFKRSGDVHARLGTQLKTLLNDVTFDNDSRKLGGQMAGDIGTEDANRRPYRLHLDLRFRGDTLSGSMVAISHLEGAPGGAPGRRVGNALSHWAELRRQE
jgi:CubicO group peptidase (beta-lactamase class C family)